MLQVVFPFFFKCIMPDDTVSVTLKFSVNSFFSFVSESHLIQLPVFHNRSVGRAKASKLLGLKACNSVLKVAIIVYMLVCKL